MKASIRVQTVCTALCVAAAVVLAACASGGAHRSTTSAVGPGAPVAAANDVPAGWMRYSYGALSVAAPATWKLNRTEPANCFPPGPQTITEWTASKPEMSACGSGPINIPPPPSVTISCFVGKLKHLYYGGPAVATVSGVKLYGGNNLLYVQDTDSETMVSATGTDAMTRQILATVQPSNGHC